MALRWKGGNRVIRTVETGSEAGGKSRKGGAARHGPGLHDAAMQELARRYLDLWETNMLLYARLGPAGGAAQSREAQASGRQPS